MQVLRVPDFDAKLSRMRDDSARARILIAIQRLASGNQGDWKSLGHGLFELRIHYGPGYRVYFTWRGVELLILLLCGSKHSQDGDIRKARKLLE